MAPPGGREWSKAHESRSLSLLTAPGLALHKPRRPGGLRLSHSPEQGATTRSSGGVQAVPSTQLRPEPAGSAGGWRGWSSITPSTLEGMGCRLAPAEPRVAQPRRQEPRMQMWTKRVAGDSEAPSLESRWMWRYPAGRVAPCQLLCPRPHMARRVGCRPQPTPGVAWLRAGSWRKWAAPVNRVSEAWTPHPFPPHQPPPTLLQTAERQRELAHEIIGGGDIIILYHEPDQRQLWNPQLELQGLPPAGVEA